MISHRQALDWLLADDHWWLWSMETKREAMRLQVALAPLLDAEMLQELEHAILAGPPREMFRDDIEPERCARIMDREIWLRLARVVEAGTVLHVNGKERLTTLSAQYPEWQLAVDQSDEFPFWTGSGDEWREFTSTPRRRSDLIEWLKQQPSTDHWQEDDWQQRCRDNFSTTACALYALTKEGLWPTDRWREALQAWSEEKLLKRSWRYMAPVLSDAPNDQLQTLAHGLSWWLQAVAKTFEGHDVHFFRLARRLLAQDHQDGLDTDEPVMRAINHPVGHVTEALLRCRSDGSAAQQRTDRMRYPNRDQCPPSYNQDGQQLQAEPTRCRYGENYQTSRQHRQITASVAQSDQNSASGTATSCSSKGTT